MTQVWIYTVASSKDPDQVACVVPWQVDEEQIFFGPCKVRMREQLRRQYLSSGCNYTNTIENLFIVGINGSNKEQLRKVIWYGKLSAVMTFAEADKRLRGDSFRDLRESPYSPLHVRPVVKDGRLLGYEHTSLEHVEGDLWVSDLVSSWHGFRKKGRSLIIKRGWTPWEVFDRDCCMLLVNRFFAQGQGIEFDEEALRILRDAQPQKKAKIDYYAVFGRTTIGQPDGLKGRYLAIDGELAKRFVAWLEDRSHKVVRHSQGGGSESAKKTCTSYPSKRRCRTVC
ncbi:MAG TPA: hypothetical protein VH592_06600 [Gemmataceae bacterium]|jgi:hypothetical protein